MAARSTMGDLINLLRLAVGDAAGEDRVFSDEELQTFLDARGIIAHEFWLEPRGYSRVTIQCHDFYSQYQNWEADAVIYSADGTEIECDAPDYLRGHYHFTNAQTPPLFIRGTFYDVNAAAADALEAWAGKVATEFDFSTPSGSFDRSQKHAQLLALAKQYRARQFFGVGSTELRRSDM